MSNRSIQLKDADGSLFPKSMASLITDGNIGKTQAEINADIYTKLTGATPGNTLTYHGRKVSLVTPGDYTVGIKSLLSTNYGSHFTEQTWNGGLAISDGIAVLTFNYGFLVMLNWADKSLLATGKAACYSTTNHAGNCSFGTTHYSGNKIPLLYISECDETHNKSYRCFVENVVQNGSDLTCSNVQTITYNGTKLNSTHTTDWAVDPIEGYLYGYGYKPGETQNSSRNTIVMMRFRIPEITSKTVTLTDSDVLATKEVSIDGILQGCSVSGGVFLYPYSNNENGGVTGNGMVVYDFNNDELLFKTSLWDYTKKELEGGCLYNGKAYVVGHTYDQNNADAEYIEVSFP